MPSFQSSLALRPGAVTAKDRLGPFTADSARTASTAPLRKWRHGQGGPLACSGRFALLADGTGPGIIAAMEDPLNELNPVVQGIIKFLYPEVENPQALERMTRVDPNDVAEVVQDLDVERRFLLSMSVTRDLMRADQPLIRGKNQTEKEIAFDRCCTYLWWSWAVARGLLKAQAYSHATAVAIICIEETGKLSVERFRLSTLDFSQMELGESELRASFTNHHTKHVLAAFWGALMNSEIHRILGLPFVAKFLDDAESKKLETLRQSCLYMERKSDGTLHIPIEVIQKDDAVRYVALAGEIFVEMLAGLASASYKDLISDLTKFEIEEGLTTPENEEAARSRLD